MRTKKIVEDLPEAFVNDSNLWFGKCSIDMLAGVVTNGQTNVTVKHVDTFPLEVYSTIRTGADQNQ